MICPSCGAQNHADFSFCLQCGHPLGQADQNGEQLGVTRADVVPIEAGTMAMPGLPPGGPGGARLRVDQGSVDDQFIDLSRPLTVIGRRQGSDIVIHDTNVSRMHAQIKRDGTRFLVEDTNSSNGTIVNDERIERARELQPGDVIRIGDAVFIFEHQIEEESAEGSTMAIDLESPMTSLGGAPELIPPGMGMPQPSPLTPPPAIMDPSHTALAESPVFEDEVSPPPAPSRPAAPPPAPAPVVSQPVVSQPAAAPSPAPSSRGRSGTSAPSGSTAAQLESLRKELTEVGRDLQTFSGTLGGIADKVERLERALDASTGDLAQLADAIKGPDGTVLKELQGILTDMDRIEGPALEAALTVLEQLSAQPRDIELLLKLSQQVSSIEAALRIHGRLVAAAPRLKTTLTRLTG